MRILETGELIVLQEVVYSVLPAGLDCLVVVKSYAEVEVAKHDAHSPIRLLKDALTERLFQDVLKHLDPCEDLAFTCF